MTGNPHWWEHITEDEIPWGRLTTAYGRADGIPAFLKDLREMQDMEAVKTALTEICVNIEHQDTLWQATPFAMIFLVRIFEHALGKAEENEIARYIVEQLLDFFALIAECAREGEAIEHELPLSSFSAMLDEKYLWPEEYDEEEDDARWEDGDCFPDDLLYSFYFYSYQVLQTKKEVFSNAGQPALEKTVKQLLQLL